MPIVYPLIRRGASLPAVGSTTYIFYETTTGKTYFWDDVNDIWREMTGPTAGVHIMPCDAAVVVGDAVYTDGTGTLQKACSAIGVTRTDPAEYIISQKPSATTCVAVSDGTVSGFVGLTPGAEYFLDLVAGGITSVVPTFAGGFDYLQNLGVAESATDLGVDVDSTVAGLS